jgi:hypothetical protein
MYRINGNRNARDSKIHAQRVGSVPQWSIGQYIMLTTKASNLIDDKMQ